MALGVRSYGNSLLVQNIYNPDNLPDTDKALQAFAYKILRPSVTSLEVECGTTIGRVIQIPESDPIGLIHLETNTTVVEQDIVDNLEAGIFIMRVRDTAHCVSQRSPCINCGRGYYARIGRTGSPSIGIPFALEGDQRAYQNYIANTFSGAAMGYAPLSASPLPTKARDWDYITSHNEMDRMCQRLSLLNVPSDDLDYLRSVENVLERALLIIGTYGVYGNV